MSDQDNKAYTDAYIRENGSAAYIQNAQQMQNITPYPQQPPSYYPGNTTVVVGGAMPYALPPPKDHLVWSIFNAVLLCPILGIIAIIFSVLSRNRKEEGHIEEARGHSSTAFGLNIAGTVLGCIGWLIFIPCIIVWAIALSAAAEETKLYNSYY